MKPVQGPGPTPVLDAFLEEARRDAARSKASEPPSIARLAEITDWREARIAISPSSHDAERLWIETEEYDGISRERAAVELTRAQATKLCTALMAWIGGVR